MAKDMALTMLAIKTISSILDARGVCWEVRDAADEKNLPDIHNVAEQIMNNLKNAESVARRLLHIVDPIEEELAKTTTQTTTTAAPQTSTPNVTTPRTPQNEILMGTEDVAKYLKVPKDHIYKLNRYGTNFPKANTIRLKNQNYFVWRKSAIDAWIDKEKN